ncbi:hypothetical protein AVEN_250098-1, partial [Araneus ventricosus]
YDPTDTIRFRYDAITLPFGDRPIGHAFGLAPFMHVVFGVHSSSIVMHTSIGNMWDENRADLNVVQSDEWSQRLRKQESLARKEFVVFCED